MTPRPPIGIRSPGSRKASATIAAMPAAVTHAIGTNALKDCIIGVRGSGFGVRGSGSGFPGSGFPGSGFPGSGFFGSGFLGSGFLGSRFLGSRFFGPAAGPDSKHRKQARSERIPNPQSQ